MVLPPTSFLRGELVLLLGPQWCPFTVSFFVGRVPLLKSTTEKQTGYPYSNLSNPEHPGSFPSAFMSRRQRSFAPKQKASGRQVPPGAADGSILPKLGWVSAGWFATECVWVLLFFGEFNGKPKGRQRTTKDDNQFGEARRKNIHTQIGAPLFWTVVCGWLAWSRNHH